MASRRASAAARFERFEVAAFLGREHHGRLSVDLGRALLHGHALSVSTIPDVAVLASASGYADTRAQRIGVLARAVATLALAEFLVGVHAHTRYILDHGGDGTFALFFRHANSLGVSQMTVHAETTNDAVLGAERAVFGTSAGRSASRTAGQEFFLFGARRDRGGGGGDDRLFLSIACAGEHAFTLVVSQIAGFAETAAHASERAVRRMGTSAGGRARRTTFEIEGVDIAALIIGIDDGIGRVGQSKTDGGKTEQQRES